MPSSVEILLGVKGAGNIARELGVLFSSKHLQPPQETATLDDLRDDEWEDAFMDLGVDLHKAFEEAMQASGFTRIAARRPQSLDIGDTWDTPLGPRQFAGFSFELFYDPEEIGDTPETASFGVSLSGRYCPTFLDWEDPHGTLYKWVMNQAAMTMMQTAKNCIAKYYPQAAEWDFIVQERFY